MTTLPLADARANLSKLYRIMDRRLVVEVVSVVHRRDAYHR